MSNFIKLSTKQYPLHEGDIRLEHPEITEDQTGDTFPCPSEYALVLDTPRPTVNVSNNEIITESAPIQLPNGQWQRVWNIEKMTDEHIEFLKNYKTISMNKPRDVTANGSTPDVIG